MKTILREIHYMMYENTAESKKLKEKDPKDSEDAIRADQEIIDCRKIHNILEKLEIEIIKKIKEDFQIPYPDINKKQ